MAETVSADKEIESILHKRLGDLEARLSTDMLAYVGRILYGTDTAFRDVIESRENKSRKLGIILETDGGYIEVAERIVNTIRRFYDEVDFYVVDHAMSAGTVLVMSSDAIHMDYYSILGPIDPQVERPGGAGLIPALGYLYQYERLLEKDRNGTLTTAEAQILIECFDQAELHNFEEARKLTITLLKQWLTKYKFKNWKVTATNKITVTDQMKEERASEIAVKLSDASRWHSHSRGIPIDVLKTELNLLVEDFGTDKELQSGLRAYHRLLRDYMAKMGQFDVLHMPDWYEVL